MWIIDEGAVRPAERRKTERQLYEFVPLVSPGFTAPHHLDPIVRTLDKALRGGVQICTSTPPRHVKTSTIYHWMVQQIAERPRTFLGYATYNQSQARAVSRKARAVAAEAGLEFEVDTLDQWVLKNGSMVTWGGVGASWTGKGFHCIICDDLVKDRKAAESALIRETAWEWFNGTIYTRQEPGEDAVSVIVNGTRWHHDDPIGRLRKMGWPFINLKALNDNDEALWPEGFSAKRLHGIAEQVGPYEFGALYQGEPIAKGAEVFGPPTYFDTLPMGLGFRSSVGNDFAYTVRTWSDFSVAVALRRYTNGVCYVVEVLRKRCELPAFKAELRALSERHPGAEIVAFVSGTERGGLQFFGEGGHDERVLIKPLNATGDKFQRTQVAAAAWNAGKLQIPSSLAALGECGWHLKADDEGRPPWLAAFLDELRSFTGVKDAHDDQVDALAGAFEPFRNMLQPSTGDAPVAGMVTGGGSESRYSEENGGDSHWF